MESSYRSWMFVPGNRERFIDKASTLNADAVFFDLEDGVVPADKAAARRLVGEALERPPGGPARYVRVNQVGSRWLEEDWPSILVPGLEGVCLPKVQGPDEVREAAERLRLFEAEHGLDPSSIGIVAAIESARGLLNAAAIGAGDPRVAALMFGAEDFALDIGLGARREREGREFLYARSALVVSAAAARVGAIDGVFPDLQDHEGLLADTLQARHLGFSGKALFHPSQVDAVNSIFDPTEEEIAYAKRVVGAFREAVHRGEGSAAVGGQLVDLPIVRRAERLLQRVGAGVAIPGPSREGGSGSR